MISTSDFRKGIKIMHRGEPHMVVDFAHNKMGRGGALVRAKLKNLITGSTFEENFRSEQKFDDPQLERKDMQYLYADGGLYHFMDQDSYEQVPVSKDVLEDVLGYLKEQESYDMLYFKDKIIGVTPPISMIFEVKETPPGVRGDTAQGGATKPATLETGIVVQVPLFVNEGDKIKVDTRTGVYVERV